MKAPSLLPKYVTDYIVHKEAVRQLFLNGFGSYLFDIKKDVFHHYPSVWVVTSSPSSRMPLNLLKSWKICILVKRNFTGMILKERLQYGNTQSKFQVC